MNIMVVGGGGREHAIIKKLRENPSVRKIFCLPGNGGIAADAECVPVSSTDLTHIIEFASAHEIDFAVVAQDDPLALGCVDRLHELGIPCFGPDQKAARIEASKVFSKNLMKKYGIPTADYEVFGEPSAALDYLASAKYPIVIKADGLALGKGVLICEDQEAARDAIHGIMEERKFGDAGKSVVIERFMTGPEVSVLSFTDGKTIVPMVSSMDHKRAGDGNTGLNTGGMGTIAPNPYYTKEIADICMERIFLPTIRAMRAEGCPFKGCLYFGLMLTEEGPVVIEYNCRFGDPEAQVVLPLLETDLLTVMQAVENETLDQVDVKWSEGAAACVIIASGGYPLSYEKGKTISIPDTFPENVTVFHAGDKLENGSLVTSGGRVLGVAAAGSTLKNALKDAYAAAERIHFEGAFMRHDIGRQALKADSSGT